MADTAAVTRIANGIPQPGSRDITPRAAAVSGPGSLELKDRVGVKIAEAAALDVNGVIRYTSGGLIGGGYPRVQAQLSSPATISMTIAVAWPSPLTDICNNVRARVISELERLTGITPARVDVDIAECVTAANISADRPRVQ